MLPFVQRKWMVGTMLEGELPFMGWANCGGLRYLPGGFRVPQALSGLRTSQRKSLSLGSRKMGRAFLGGAWVNDTSNTCPTKVVSCFWAILQKTWFFFLRHSGK